MATVGSKELDFSPITFHSYEKAQAFNFLTPKEVFAMRVAAWSLLDEPTIVNIGSGAGTSGLAFVESRPDAKVYTVDISPGGPFGGLQNEINAFEGKGLQLPTHILGDSKDAGAKWRNGKVDMVFIDGDHSYNGCMGDIMAWYPHVKVGGLILFHDYRRDVWPDVHQAINDALVEFKLSEVLIVDTLFIARKC